MRPQINKEIVHSVVQWDGFPQFGQHKAQTPSIHVQDEWECQMWARVLPIISMQPK